jgi:hypothetical protein
LSIIDLFNTKRNTFHKHDYFTSMEEVRSTTASLFNLCAGGRGAGSKPAKGTELFFKLQHGRNIVEERLDRNFVGLEKGHTTSHSMVSLSV